jgi:hypothetical protein
MCDSRAVSRRRLRERKNVADFLLAMARLRNVPKKNTPAGEDRSPPQRYSPWIVGRPVIAKTLDALPPNIFTQRGQGESDYC